VTLAQSLSVARGQPQTIAVISDSIEQLITFDDTVDPQFTFCPEGGDLGCNPAGIPEPGIALATDNCGVPSITSLPGDIIADGCYRSFTRTYVATDYCGNVAYCYQTYTWTVDLMLAQHLRIVPARS
jgi:hypothetical protein